MMSEVRPEPDTCIDLNHQYMTVILIDKSSQHWLPLPKESLATKLFSKWIKRGAPPTHAYL